MTAIEIQKKDTQPAGWHFTVLLTDGEASTSHEVAVREDYWQKLTDGDEAPEDLVRRSFAFLLEREPKESILPQFDLEQITTYFPDYEKEIHV